MNDVAVCESVFEEAHTKWSHEGPSALTVGERTVICVMTFFGEMCNGGLETYLGNESGLLAEYGVESLRLIGLDRYADLLEKVFPHCVKTSEGAHGDEMATRYEIPEDESECDVLQKLEKKFFQLYTKKAFSERRAEYERPLASYIRNNEDQFVRPQE